MIIVCITYILQERLTNFYVYIPFPLNFPQFSFIIVMDIKLQNKRQEKTKGLK